MHFLSLFVNFKAAYDSFDRVELWKKYGREQLSLWARKIDPEEEHALGVFERKVLRTIYGGVQLEVGTWSRWMNHELHQLLGEPTITLSQIAKLEGCGDASMSQEYRITTRCSRKQSDRHKTTWFAASKMNR